KSHLGLYGDVVHEIDWSVGEVLSAVKRNGIEHNTLVFFTGDHGPWYQGSTGLLRGRKGTTYEGGLRIPMIARLPGALPQGRTTDALASHLDMLPTLTNLCGGSLPQEALDGTDIWPLLTCEQQAVERKALLSFSGWHLECARSKQWKLHVTRSNMPSFLPPPKNGRIQFFLRNPELYNLADDPKESYDVAAEYPEVIAEIQKSLAEQLATLPDRVKQVYSRAQQHLTNPWMPPDAYSAETEDAAPGRRDWLSGSDAERVLQMFK
ncbi:MAG: sulfatase-like hydrolase/transferase, partial [Bryobacteraceae bacterium]